MAERDVDAVADNEARAYAFPWPRRAFADCLRAAYDCHVVELDGRLVGHGIVAVSGGEAQLLNVCIEPRAQGQGCGRLLADFLLRRAAALCATVAYLEVRPSNQTAIALYRKLGFREIARRRNYYRALVGREDALIMALELAVRGRDSAPPTGPRRGYTTHAAGAAMQCGGFAPMHQSGCKVAVQ